MSRSILTAAAIAFLMAMTGLLLAATDTIPPMEVIEDPLPWPEEQRQLKVRMALSRERFHAEDGHLDVILERGHATPVLLIGEHRLRKHWESFLNSESIPFEATETLPDPSTFERHRLVILVNLAEPPAFSETDNEAVERYVRNGGRLIASVTFPHQIGGEQKVGADTSELEWLGAKQARYGTHFEQCRVLSTDDPLTAHLENGADFGVTDGRVASLYQLTTAIPLVGNENHAAVAVNDYGEGRAIYIRSVPPDDPQDRPEWVKLFRAAVTLPSLAGWPRSVVDLPGNQTSDKAAAREQVRGTGHGVVRVSVNNQAGETLYTRTFPAPSDSFVCYPPIPKQLVSESGSVEAAWRLGDKEWGTSTAAFRVASPAETPREGRVRLEIPNPTGATVRGLPQTVGVPFPRGSLEDEAHVRLVDASAQEIPLQTKVTSRWSRFGSIRWLQCDFTTNLTGGPAELFLEFGPEVSRTDSTELLVQRAYAAPVIPVVETGNWRFGPEGIESDPSGAGSYQTVVENESLTGAFVEREDGQRYEIPLDNPVQIEEEGPEKVVLTRSGWYMNTRDWGDVFCKYKTRYIIHRDSPLVRVFHTWIYTGDANEDRIRDMGWEFNPAEGLEPQGILTEFGSESQWLPGQYLVQHDFNKADIADESGQVQEQQLRAPGVISMAGKGMRLYFGVKDFWQNYPREVEFTDDSMVFHEWPRHGRNQRRPTTSENKMQLWFAHEGEVLDFRMPQEYGEEEIQSGLRHEQYWPEGQPEAVNAQGVAKTSEFWLYLTDDQTPPEEAEKVLEGLNDETLRAVVDPEWVADSGALYEMHAEDRENYPSAEETYELHATAPMRWAERMRIYGKWVWGNILWSPNLEKQTAGIYRGFRKAHQGWPYSWLPFARSGDARYLKFADAATRTMTDVNFCHYSDHRTGNRPRGQWYRGALPWTGSGRGKPYAYPPGPQPVTRGYSDQCDYQLRSWLLTGYRRAKDVNEDWASLVKTHYAEDGSLLFPYATAPNPRRTVNLLRTYTQMYDQTHDPWFIMAAHVLAQRKEPWEGWRMHFWKPGNREYHRFTGSESMREYYVEEYAPEWTDPTDAVDGWAANCPQMRQPAYAWRLTGDEDYLKRIVGWLTLTRVATYDGEPAYRRGTILYGIGNVPLNYTAYYLRQFPYALAALADAGKWPEPMPSAFFQAPAQIEKADDDTYHWKMPTVAIRKEADQAIPLRLAVNVHRRPPDDQKYQYLIVGPEGATVLDGQWDITEEHQVTIPSESPAGTYRVQVEGHDPYTPYGSSNVRPIQAMRALRVPLSPPGVPEVIEFDPDDGLGTAFYHAMYWTRVPEDCEQFQVDFSLQTRDRWPSMWGRVIRLNRVAVWNPERQAEWMEQHLIENYDGPESVTARVTVPPEHRGSLWKITAPGWSRGVKPGPEMPPYVAVSSARWFQP